MLISMKVSARYSVKTYKTNRKMSKGVAPDLDPFLSKIFFFNLHIRYFLEFHPLQGISPVAKFHHV